MKGHSKTSLQRVTNIEVLIEGAYLKPNWLHFFVTDLLTGQEKERKGGEPYAHLFTRKKAQGLVVQNVSWSCMT